MRRGQFLRECRFGVVHGDDHPAQCIGLSALPCPCTQRVPQQAWVVTERGVGDGRQQRCWQIAQAGNEQRNDAVVTGIVRRILERARQRRRVGRQQREFGL